MVNASLARWGATRLSRRLVRAVPFLGILVGAATLGAAIRRKGLFGGVLDTTLTAVPFVGAAKTVLEVARGRDLIANRKR
jgi:hypothetical protein